MALDIGADRALSRKAMKAELLDAETELQLAYAWKNNRCLLYTSPSPRDSGKSRMPSSA